MYVIIMKHNVMFSVMFTVISLMLVGSVYDIEADKGHDNESHLKGEFLNVNLALGGTITVEPIENSNDSTISYSAITGSGIYIGSCVADKKILNVKNLEKGSFELDTAKLGEKCFIDAGGDVLINLDLVADGSFSISQKNSDTVCIEGECTKTDDKLDEANVTFVGTLTPIVVSDEELEIEDESDKKPKKSEKKSHEGIAEAINGDGKFGKIDLKIQTFTLE